MIKHLNNFSTYQGQAIEPKLSLTRCEVVYQLAQTLQENTPGSRLQFASLPFVMINLYLKPGFRSLNQVPLQGFP